MAREELVAQAVAEARQTARLTRLQFVEGEADLRDSLDAEERLIAAEDALALARQQRLEAAIDLFRATGGRLS
jgi:outer membrane protein TolC